MARIAVDLLGGDGAPAVVVDGALRACSADPDLHLLLVGPREVADEVIGALPVADRERVSVIVVDSAVGMGDSPLRNIRRTTSVRAAAEALYTGHADAMVSAGSSGAAVAASAHVLGRLRGVRRPGLAAQMPTERGPVLLIDVGVTLDATMLELVQHAVLGTAYAAVALGIPRPRVGLLSIGSEPGKGDRLRRAVSIALSDIPLPAGGRYVGLVEGFDVPRGGPADVIVTDGFTGNVLLKGIEAALATTRRQTGMSDMFETVGTAGAGERAVPEQTAPASAPEQTASERPAHAPMTERVEAERVAPTATAVRGAPERPAPAATAEQGRPSPTAERATPVPTAEWGTPASTAERGTPVPAAEWGTPASTAERGTPASTAEWGTPAPAAERGTPDPTAGPGAPGQYEAAAVLLGVAGDVVVCHGSAGGAEIADGIALAARLHRDRITPAVAGLADDLLTELSSAGGLTIRDALGERS